MNREMNETTEFEYLDDISELSDCSNDTFANYFPSSHLTITPSVNLQNYEIIGQNRIDPKSLWLVSPIVGMIHNGQVAITGVYDLGDIDIVVIYQCSSSGGGSGSSNYNKKSIITSIKEKTPFTIFLTGLLEDQEYIINWYIRQSYICIFSHQIKTGKFDKIILVSCDKPQHEVTDSVWNMIDALSSKPLTIFHVGNQIYANKIYRQSMNLSDIDTNKKYLELYKNTFMSKYNILANNQNIMTLNDGDIGTQTICNLINPEPEETHVMEIGKQMYRKIQESLHINTLFVVERCWIKNVGDGLVMVNIETVSGDLQVDKMIDTIDLAINKYQPNRLIINFSQIPLPSPKGRSGYIYKKIWGRGKFWNKQELSILYNYILSWIDMNRTERDVVIVGGDHLFGGIGTVMRGNSQFTIIVTGPVTAQPGLGALLAACGIDGVHEINSNIRLYMTQVAARRCYASLFIGSNRHCKMIPDIHYSRNILPKNTWLAIKS